MTRRHPIVLGKDDIRSCRQMLDCEIRPENTLDIALDTLPSLVFIFQVKECVTQTLQNLQISRDPQTRVRHYSTAKHDHNPARF